LGAQVDVAAVLTHLRSHLGRHLVRAEPVDEPQRTDDRHGDPTVDPRTSAQRAPAAARRFERLGHPATTPMPATAPTTGWPSSRRSCRARSWEIVVVVSISTSS